ncbi:D-galactarate dehydratase [uncultured Jannaschia sp.]|uniref:D-galactarate dehydratase n=1 Tax=uncultured Jannaschia sp. TaxID=293347 RepID=UPI0026339BBB|nr:D-galactarate dehydratase [uncultured Jannaschia sp.]
MIRTIPLLALILAGCAQIPFLNRGASTSTGSAPTEVPAPLPAGSATAPDTVVAPPRAVTASAAALDTVSEEQKAAARAEAAAAPAGGELGTVTVALGDPADPGLWVKSDLVSADTPGTVRTGDGDAIAVTLRPLGSDGGAQISLPALRALGLPLTGLHPVTLAST